MFSGAVEREMEGWVPRANELGENWSEAKFESLGDVPRPTMGAALREMEEWVTGRHANAED